MDERKSDQVQILRVKDVLATLNIGRTSLWRWRRSGSFPAPIQLGARMIGWQRSEVEQWLGERPRHEDHMEGETETT